MLHSSPDTAASPAPSTALQGLRAADLSLLSASATVASASVQAAPAIVGNCIDVVPCDEVLFDARAESEIRVDDLRVCLPVFFEPRSDLNDTLYAAFMTHPHIGRTQALKQAASNVLACNYVNNDDCNGMGGGDEPWLVDQIAQGRPTAHGEIRETDATSSAELRMSRATLAWCSVNTG
jgi:hypothetical protein